MDGPRWEQVKQIVADAIDLKPDARVPFLEKACAGDEQLRNDVETLLRFDEPASPFLDLDRGPERLGPYRVVREIGRGGMGAVYLGERSDGQFEQRVAIKVIKRGMDTDAVLRRFFAERRMMARLQHPNITRLMDGGAFDGRPYFVMEFIEGEPITEYCLHRNLTVRDRIGLFLAVCEAVEHAHRNLILHRDIKATNILVDAAGAPKLLDFGIAKLLENDGTAEQSLLDARPMTPQSASPEQVRGEPLTTASDVYSLGLLLFVLLAGKPPYQLRSASPAELARAVCEDPIPRPSVLAPPDLARELRGDLDNIVLKALRKEPAQRYQRAAELADDLRRYLSGMPVNAGRGGMRYRALKFIGRHRRVLAAAAIAIAVLAAAVTDAVLQGQRAQRRFQDLRQLAGSFLFEFHDAIATLPGATPARELVVKRALQYLDGMSREAAGDIGLKQEVAEGYLRVGEVQGDPFEANLGKTADAQVSIQKALALFEEVVRARPADAHAKTGLAVAQLRLSALIQGNGHNAAGLALNRQTIALLEGVARTQKLEPRADVALGMAYFGVSESQMAMNHNAEALDARLRSVAAMRDALAQDPANAEAQRWYGQTEKRLAYLYLNSLHDPAKAAESLRFAMEIDERRVAAHPGDAVAKMDLALGQAYMAAVIHRQGDLAGGRELLERALASRREVLTADPQNVRARYLLITDYAHLGGWLRDEKRSAEARAAFQKGMELTAEVDSSRPPISDALKVLRTEMEK